MAKAKSSKKAGRPHYVRAAQQLMADGYFDDVSPASVSQSEIKRRWRMAYGDAPMPQRSDDSRADNPKKKAKKTGKKKAAKKALKKKSKKRAKKPARKKARGDRGFDRFDRPFFMAFEATADAEEVLADLVEEATVIHFENEVDYLVLGAKTMEGPEVGGGWFRSGESESLIVLVGGVESSDDPSSDLANVLELGYFIAGRGGFRLRDAGVKDGAETLWVGEDDWLVEDAEDVRRVANRAARRPSLDYASMDGPPPGALPKKGKEMLRSTFQGSLQYFYETRGLPLEEAENLASRTAWTQVKRHYYKDRSTGKWKKRKRAIAADKHPPGSKPASHYQKRGGKKRKANQADLAVLQAKAIVDAANKYSAALREELQAIESGTPRQLAEAQERVRQSRTELRALTGGSRQLYGAMAFGAGGAGLGAALAGVPGAVVGALVGSIAGQIALRPRVLSQETGYGRRRDDDTGRRGRPMATPPSPDRRTRPSYGPVPRTANPHHEDGPLAVVYVVSEEGTFLVGDPTHGEAMVVTVEEAVAYATMAQDHMDREGNPDGTRHDVCLWESDEHVAENLMWSTAPDGYTRAGQKERVANKPRKHRYYTVITFTPNSKSVRGKARLAAQQVDKIDRHLRKKDLSVAIMSFPGDARSNQVMLEAKVKADEGKHTLIVAAPPSSPEVKAILDLYGKGSVKHRRIRALNPEPDPLAGLDAGNKQILSELYERWVFSEEQNDPNEALYDVWEYESDFPDVEALVAQGFAAVVDSSRRGPELHMVIRISGKGAAAAEAAMTPGSRHRSTPESRKDRARSLNGDRKPNALKRSLLGGG